MCVRRRSTDVWAGESCLSGTGCVVSCWAAPSLCPVPLSSLQNTFIASTSSFVDKLNIYKCLLCFPTTLKIMFLCSVVRTGFYAEL